MTSTPVNGLNQAAAPKKYEQPISKVPVRASEGLLGNYTERTHVMPESNILLFPVKHSPIVWKLKTVNLSSYIHKIRKLNDKQLRHFYKKFEQTFFVPLFAICNDKQIRSDEKIKMVKTLTYLFQLVTHILNLGRDQTTISREDFIGVLKKVKSVCPSDGQLVKWLQASFKYL